MDTEVTVQDLINYSYEQKPVEFQQAFNNLVVSRIAAAVDDRKIELAQSMFNPPEESNELETDVDTETTTDTDTDTNTDEVTSEPQEDEENGEVA